MTTVTSELADRPLARTRKIYEAEIDMLIRVTVEAAADSPTCEVTVAQILQQAGLSTSAFYRHFSSKEELWLAVLRYGREILLKHILQEVAQAPSYDAAVLAWVDCMLDQARNDAAARRTRPFAVIRPRLLLLFPEVVSHSDRTLIGPLVNVIAEAKADGVYPAASPDADARLVFLMVQEFVSELLLKAVKPDLAAVRHVHEMVLAMVRRASGGNDEH